MKKYIDKDALAAEIEERKKELIELSNGFTNRWACASLDDILSFINTLEVKEVKEPNASDRGMAEEIIINLKRVEQDYHIDLTKEMEWLRNKVKKGEEV
jgi:hypothetical protein